MRDMKEYKKQVWLNHIVEKPGEFIEVELGDGVVLHIPNEGEILQEGSPYSENRMNHIEDGIYNTSKQSKANKDDIISLAVEVAILKNASLNNFTNNIFIVNFANLDSVELVHGVYDEVGKRLVV